MEKEKTVVSCLRKRPFRLTWINPRTGLLNTSYFTSLTAAVDKLYSMIKTKDIAFAEVWERVYPYDTEWYTFERRYSYVDIRSMHDEGEVAL